MGAALKEQQKPFFRNSEGIFHPKAFIPLVWFLFAALVLPFIPVGLFTTIFATLSIVALFLFHMQTCFSLTFDGFLRFSRYRLSQKHPILDKVVSSLTIVFCFIGGSPLALFMKAYSLVVSPDNNENDRPFYKRSFMVPLVQGIVLFAAFSSLYFGDFS